MTKQEFVQKIADRAGLSRRDAGKAVDAFLETMTETLNKGDTVAFPGFGKFATVPTFMAGSNLKTAVK